MIALLAWRNIWRNKARSIVIMSSIALGLFAGLAVLALYEGMLSSRIRTVIDEETGHIQMHHPLFANEYESKYTIDKGIEVMQIISNMSGIAMVNQRVLVNGMLSTPTGTSGVQIIGMDTTTEYTYSSLQVKMKDGYGFRRDKKNQAIIGKKLADKMKLKTGSKMVLMFNDTINNLVSGAFRIVGIYQSSNAPLEEKIIYVSKDELGALLGIPRAIHEIGIKLKVDNSVDTVAAALKRKYPKIKVETWKEISPETNFMVKTVDTYSYLIMIIIMIALAFGILNTMLMAVMERTREIGMIAALGTNKTKIFNLILLETVFLTLAGAPIGILLAWTGTTWFNLHGLNLSGMGEDMMRNFGFQTLIYPQFPSEKLLTVIMIVVATALISSLIPAIKAINMKPVDAFKK